MHNVFLVVGARPNFVKAASLLLAAEKQNVDIDIIHIGQHYDGTMNKTFFR